MISEAIQAHFASGSKICFKCGIRPVQGCRCVMGATHCSECYDHGPVRTLDEIVKEHADKMADSIMDKIDAETLRLFKV